MKKTVFTALIVFFTSLLFSGCDIIDEIIGSGNIISIEKDFTDFTKVEISNAFSANIVSSDSYGVEIRIDDNIEEYLNVIKEGDTLKIYLDPNHIYSNVTLEADIAMPDLSSLNLSGATDATISGLNFEHTLNLELSGASSITGEGDMFLGMIKFDLSGASMITLQGYGGDLDINASGASTLRLIDLISDNGIVNLSGASNATINLTGTLSYNLSGASTLDYYGSPAIGSTELSGSSTANDLGPH